MKNVKTFLKMSLCNSVVMYFGNTFSQSVKVLIFHYIVEVSSHYTEKQALKK